MWSQLKASVVLKFFDAISSKFAEVHSALDEVGSEGAQCC